MIVIALCLLTAQVFGADQESAFEQGVAASQRGDHAAAIEFFQQARSAGRDDGRLHYNLGVSYYKLARYDLATKSFQRAAEDPGLKPLAYYNLALVAASQGDNQTADRWLQRCLAVAEDQKLRSLAETLQEKINPDRGRTSAALSSADAYFSINAGYDNNVLLRADTLTLSAADQGDMYFDLFAYGGIGIRDAGGLRLDASTYQLRYDDLNQYDLGLVRLGGSLSRNLAGWRHDPGLHLSFYTLGGNALYRTTSLDIDSRRRLQDNTRLRLGYMAEHIHDADANYAYLEGWRHRFRARSTWSLPEQRQMQLEYILELNDRQDLTTGTTFTSYSPLRQSLRFKGTIPLDSNLKGSLGLRFRDSRYRDSNILSGGGTVRRHEQRYDVIAGLSRTLTDKTELEAEYRFTSNQSNLASYDYTRHQIQLGIAISL